jgi:predicted enzyme related to lactoylglutathione lyase
MATVGVLYMLQAADMGRAVAFYRDVFDLAVRFESPDWSVVAWKDAQIALHGGGSGEFADTGLGIEVDDIDAACERVVAAGGSVRAAPWSNPEEGIQLAQLTDPEGNGFMLSQAIPGD